MQRVTATHDHIIRSVKEALARGADTAHIPVGTYEDFGGTAIVPQGWQPMLPTGPDGLTLSKFDVAIGVTPETIASELQTAFGKPLQLDCKTTDSSFQPLSGYAPMGYLTMEIAGLEKLRAPQTPSSHVEDVQARTPQAARGLY